MKVRIVLLPPQEVNIQTAKLAKKSGKLAPSDFIVDNIYLLPHITLFHLQIDQEKIPKLETVIKSSLNKVKGFNLILNKFIFDQDIWFGWYTEDSEALVNLRETLYKAVLKNKLTDKPLKQPYRPHITFNRFTSPQKAKLVSKITAKPLTFKAGTVAITYDSDTQVPAVIEKFKLT